jgi:hypothetical protein
MIDMGNDGDVSEVLDHGLVSARGVRTLRARFGFESVEIRRRKKKWGRSPIRSMSDRKSLPF